MLWEGRIGAVRQEHMQGAVAFMRKGRMCCGVLKTG